MQDNAVVDAVREKKRNSPGDDEVVEQTGDGWQMGGEIVLTQRPKNQRLDDGL
jgi:hypothetical protein